MQERRLLSSLPYEPSTDDITDQACASSPPQRGTRQRPLVADELGPEGLHEGNAPGEELPVEELLELVDGVGVARSQRGASRARCRSSPPGGHTVPVACTGSRGRCRPGRRPAADAPVAAPSRRREWGTSRASAGTRSRRGCSAPGRCAARRPSPAAGPAGGRCGRLGGRRRSRRWSWPGRPGRRPPPARGLPTACPSRCAPRRGGRR